MISSSYPASLGNVVRSKGRGLNISAYARAIRAGVAAKLSVSRSTPSATRNAAAACSAALTTTVCALGFIINVLLKDTNVDVRRERVLSSRDVSFRETALMPSDDL